LLASLADCAAALNGGGDWPSAMRAALASVGRATGVSRVWIFQLIHRADDHVIQDHIFEYAPDRKWAQLERNRFRLFKSTFACPEYRALVSGRIRGAPSATQTRTMPPSALRDDQLSQNIKAMLTAPIMVGGDWWGTLGLDDCEREILWSEDDIAFLQTVAGLIAGSIHRERQGTLARQFAVMERSTGGGMWEMDLTSHRLWCSDSLFTMLGYPPPYAQMNARLLARHLDLEDRRKAMGAVRACLRGERPGFRMDAHARRQDGTPLWLELITDVTALAAGGGVPLRLAGLVLEVGERKARELDLKRAALTDSLTGLANRRAFEQAMTQTLAATPDRGVLLMLDIDHFKRVNDRLGHDAGDAVLRAIGRLLRAAARDGDVVARLGGEEFGVFLNREDREAQRMAERLRRAVEDMTLILADLSGRAMPTQVTLSIGAARARTGEQSDNPLADLMKRADRALYRAKETGRNRVLMEDPDGARESTENDRGQSPSRQGAGFEA
jgi:diguanylate cyclase (GGDEF)-like protein